MSECRNCGSDTASLSTTPVDQTCPAVGYQRIGLCVPVTVTPFVHPKATKTKCCGNPKIKSGEMPCIGKKNGVCTFTISQTICIEVPVEFGATTTVDDIFVDCLGASADDICSNCKDEEEM